MINHPTIETIEIVRPTCVEVNLKRLKDNYFAIREKVSPAKMMPILKANAYGHGLVRIARFLQDLGADYIGVAVLEEGVLLRKRGISIPILVLGGILGNQVPHFLRYNLTITASSISKLQQIDYAAKTMGKIAKVHLKIDTGMERIGVHYYNAFQFLEKSLSCPSVNVEGIFTHFANSESRDLDYTKLQLERFMQVLLFYENNNIPLPPLRHAANSGAILQMPGAYFDMVRPGILLYGVYPSEAVWKTIPVKPSLEWKSRIVYFKVILAHHPVGYGSTWVSDKPIRAVTIPVGYGDGYFRSMSHKAHVIIRDKKYLVIGTISMDQIVANIENDSAYNGDEVILLGESENNSISCQEMAKWAGTIPYEVLTNINTRVPRVYIE